MNPGNGKTSYPHRLLGRINILLYQIIVSTIHGKHNAKTMNLKYHLQHGIKHLIYLMDRILYEIFKTILNISLKPL